MILHNQNCYVLLFIEQIRPRLTHLRAVIFYSKVFSNKEEGVIEVYEF